MVYRGPSNQLIWRRDGASEWLLDMITRNQPIGNDITMASVYHNHRTSSPVNGEEKWHKRTRKLAA